MNPDLLVTARVLAIMLLVAEKQGGDVSGRVLLGRVIVRRGNCFSRSPEKGFFLGSVHFQGQRFLIVRSFERWSNPLWPPCLMAPELQEMCVTPGDRPGHLDRFLPASNPTILEPSFLMERSPSCCLAPVLLTLQPIPTTSRKQWFLTCHDNLHRPYIENQRSFIF